MHVEACIDFPEEEIDPADRACAARGARGHPRRTSRDLLDEARAGRGASRRPHGRARRAAQRGQVEPPQPPGGRGGRDRDARGRHDARLRSRDDPPRGRADPPHRYGGACANRATRSSGSASRAPGRPSRRPARRCSSPTPRTTAQDEEFANPRAHAAGPAHRAGDEQDRPGGARPRGRESRGGERISGSRPRPAKAWRAARVAARGGRLAAVVGGCLPGPRAPPGGACAKPPRTWPPLPNSTCKPLNYLQKI